MVRSVLWRTRSFKPNACLQPPKAALLEGSLAWSFLGARGMADGHAVVGALAGESLTNPDHDIKFRHETTGQQAHQQFIKGWVDLLLECPKGPVKVGSCGVRSLVCISRPHQIGRWPCWKPSQPPGVPEPAHGRTGHLNSMAGEPSAKPWRV